MVTSNMDLDDIEEDIDNLLKGKDKETFRDIKRRMKYKSQRERLKPEKEIRYEQFDCFKYEFEMFTREEWGAQSPKFEDPWEDVKADVVIRWTETERCEDFYECSNVLKKLQREQMDRGETDIHHNFMIGPNGIVFEGRGWHIKPPRLENPDWKDVADRCLDIGIIGPKGHFPKRLEQQTAIDFIDYGTKNFHLTEKVTIRLDYFDVNQPMTEELLNYINMPSEKRP